MRRLFAYTALLSLALVAVTGCKSTRDESLASMDLRAQQAFEAGDYSQSIAIDDAILDDTGGWYDAYVRQGVAYMRLGDREKARGNFSMAIDDDPNGVLPRLYRAHLNASTGNSRAAMEDLNEVIRMGPELVTSHERIILFNLLGEIALGAGDRFEALRQFDQAIRIAASDAQGWSAAHYQSALFNSAGIFMQLGDTEESQHRMEMLEESKKRQGQRLTPEESDMLCVLHYMNGDFRGARSYLADLPVSRREELGQLLDDPTFFQHQ